MIRKNLNNLPFIFLFVATICWSTSYAQDQLLRAKKAEASLPSRRFAIRAVYDDDDSVYIFGGYRKIRFGYESIRRSSNIFQYNISSDTIRKVSSLLYPIYGGLALKGKDGKSIYYIGGGLPENLIQNFDLRTRLTRSLNDTSVTSELYSAVGVSVNGTAFIFNSVTGEILEFDMDSETVEKIGNHSVSDWLVGPRAVVLDRSGNRVWLFPELLDSRLDAENSLSVFNMETKEVSKQNTTVSNYYVDLSEGSATVSVGRYGYIVGGFSLFTTNKTRNDEGGIVRFDTMDHSLEFLPVENYAKLSSTSAVYIPKLDRIYVFGGESNGSCRDTIEYIDLHSPPLPPSPPLNTSSSSSNSSPALSTMDCEHQTVDNYPYPSDKTSFFICLNQTNTDGGVFTCPQPLIFDPILRTCNVQEMMGGFPTCEGKNGLQSYPNAWTKFIVCRGGTSHVEIYQCPEPLRFHGERKICDLHESVADSP